MDIETTLVFLNTLATVASGLLAVYFTILIWIMTMEKYKNIRKEIVEALMYGIILEGCVMVLSFEYMMGQLNEVFSLNSIAAQLMFLAFLVGMAVPGFKSYLVVNKYFNQN